MEQGQESAIATAEFLSRFLLECGAALVGFAAISEFPEESRQGYPRAVSIAVAVPAHSVAAALAAGHRWAHPDSGLYAALMTYGALTADHLRAGGYSAEVRHVTRQADVSHKAVATRAGLGWVGKCNLLVTPQYGSAVRLVSVLTDADLPVAQPVDSSRCGTCNACAEVCPADAPNGEHWAAGVGRDRFFDWRACRDVKQRAQGAEPHKSCGLCMAVCPFTQSYLRRSGVGEPPDCRVHPDLLPARPAL